MVPNRIQVVRTKERGPGRTVYTLVFRVVAKVGSAVSLLYE
jgi:hypothetical protein